MLLDNEWWAKRMNELETIKLGENLKKSKNLKLLFFWLIFHIFFLNLRAKKEQNLRRISGAKIQISVWRIYHIIIF